MNKKVKTSLLIFPMLASVMAFSSGNMRKINAATVEGKYVLDVINFKATTTGQTNQLTGSCTVNGELKNISIDVRTNYAGSEGIKYDKSSQKLKIKPGTVDSNNHTFDVEFSFVSQGDVKVEFTYDTQGNSKKMFFVANETTELAGKGVDFSYSEVGNTHNFRLVGDSSASSNVYLTNIVIIETFKSDASSEQLAEAAIDSIGEVTYSQDSYDAIMEAKNKIDACSSTQNISNYSTYESSVKQFEKLANEKINSFNEAVESIGELTKESLTDIEKAYGIYDEILSSDQEKVLVNKNNLDEIRKSYFNLFVSYANEISIDKIENVPAKYESETRLQTKEASSIFFAGVDTVIDSNNKTYNNVSYTKRLKTNGGMSYSNGVISKGIKVEAPSSGVIKAIAISGKQETLRNIQICELKDDKLEIIENLGKIVSGYEVNEFVLRVPHKGTFYIGSTEAINFYNLEFESSYACLEQQETSDGMNVRYIASLYGETRVKSWTVTLKITGLADYQVTYTNYFTEVYGNNGKQELENVVYLVASLKNIPEQYVGANIECKFEITLEDNTVLTPNSTTFTVGTQN